MLVVILGAFACNDAIIESVINEQNSLEASLQKDVGKIITNAKEAGKVTLTGIVPKDKLNDSIIYVDDGTKAWDCKTRVEVSWDFRYFTPKSGKYLGIWPFDKRVENTTRFKEVKSKWGFSKYFQPSSFQEIYFDMALDSVGFTRNDITCQVFLDTFIDKVDTYGDVFDITLMNQT